MHGLEQFAAELDASTGCEVGEEGYKALSDVRPDFGQCPRSGHKPDTRTAGDRASIFVRRQGVRGSPAIAICVEPRHPGAALGRAKIEAQSAVRA